MPPSLIEKLPEGISSNSAWTASAQFFESFGFDKLIYIDRTMAGLSMFTTFPESWTSHYRAAAYERIDPFFAYCCTSTTPMGTGIDYLSDYPYLCTAQRQLIQEAGETGMRAGMSCIVRQAGPGGAGGWNLGSSLPRHEIEKIFSEHADLLRLTAFFAHQRLQAALENEHRDIALSRGKRNASFGSRKACAASRLQTSSASGRLPSNFISRTPAQNFAPQTANRQLPSRCSTG